MKRKDKRDRTLTGDRSWPATKSVLIFVLRRERNILKPPVISLKKKYKSKSENKTTNYLEF